MKKEKTRKLCILLTLGILFSITFSLPTMVSAVTEGNYTYVISNGEAVLKYCNRNVSGAVEIPSKLGGYSVTTIINHAFANCRNLTNVTIPKSVTSIGDFVFAGCYNLTSIYVATGNTAYCSVDGNLFNKNKTTLVQYAAGKTNSSYKIPDSVTSIGAGAFAVCENLSSIIIPNSVTNIEKLAFDGCTSLKTIDLPDGIKNIGDDAFGGCSSLTNITIPQSVTNIGNAALVGCNSLMNIHVDVNNSNYCSLNGNLLNKDKTRFMQYAIGKNDSFYEIPNSVTSIDAYAFYEAENLKNITIPDSATTIGHFAFEWCKNLESVTMFNSVSEMGHDVFAGCSNLTNLYYTGSESDWDNISKGDYNGWLTTIIHYNSIIDNIDIKTAVFTNNTITVNASLTDNLVQKTGIVIIALYYKNALVSFARLMPNKNINHTFENVKSKENNYTIKIMCWDNIKNIMPLCNCENTVVQQ